MKTLSFLFVILLAFSLPAQDCLFTEVTLHTSTQDWGEELSWTLFNENNELVGSFSGGQSWSNYDTLLCLEDGCYTLIAEDSYGDGWNGGHLTISFGATVLMYELLQGSLEYFAYGINASGCAPLLPGCTDPNAINYDPNATADDGSCLSLQEVIDVQLFDTILHSGPKDNRINWVIQNRSVPNPNGNFAGQAEFVQLFEDDLFKAFTWGDPKAQAPYAQYRHFFNLYAAWWPDAPSDQDWWNFSIIQAMRDSLFLPWANEETGWATWFSTTKYGGGGGAGLDRDKRVGDGKMYGMGWETFLHEFGHTMPGLLDEYSASGEWSGGNCWETPNTTGYTDLDEIPWRLWIEPGTPLPTPYTGQYLNKIGAFEGALTNYFGCHRPTARGCFMGAGGFGEGYGLELCSPCIQRVICFLYKYVNVIENFTPAQTELDVTGPETIHFSADVLHPEPNTQKYEWILNGRVIATGVTEIDLSFGFCDTYDLTFAVIDTNTLVRYDPKFDDTYPKPYREISWHIDQTDVAAYGLTADFTTQDPDCTGAPNGMIDLSISGGQPPYSIFHKKEPLLFPLSNLAAGDYLLNIVDSNGCGILLEATLEQTPLLQPQVCSEYIAGSWSLSLQTDPYNINDLGILWSTGAQTPTISGLPNGVYSVEVVTPEGCSVVQSISLNTFEEPLTVNATSFASEPNRPTGKIFLDITGGLPPYTIHWADLTYRDITEPNTGNIQASGTTWGHLPEFAFDDNLGTKWLHFVSQNAWISYKNVSGSVIAAYSITSADDVPERDPKNWRVEGSNDGVTWTLLDQQSDQNFQKRFEKRTFLLASPASFDQYRLYITENHGDGSIQLQELEWIGRKPGDAYLENPGAEGQAGRIELAAGSYLYTVKDANQTAVTDTVEIGFFQAFTATNLKVVPNGICGVQVEIPDPGLTYFWLPDETGSAILGTGPTFQPPATGNYYVAAVTPGENGMSANRKGFAVTVEMAPQIEITADTTLAIVDPDPGLEYYWYDQADCGDPVHTGTSFTPATGTGFYYATAYRNATWPDPVDPKTLSGIVLHMDAADLDGDGQPDDPPYPTSSILDWTFEDGNSWAGWFAYRSNYQNGLGIADFATIWLQGIQTGVNGYQTILMAYEENPISFPETSPFEALSVHIPRHENASQLFSDNTPPSTLDGATYLNGEIVDPLTTPNPLEFCILGTRMTEPAGNAVYYTDTRWEGKLGELILWDHGLSNTEMEGVSEYLRRKWISTADLESPKTGIFWEYGPNSIQDISERRPISVFPNPTGGKLELKGLKKGQSLALYAPNGRLIFSEEVAAETVVWDIRNIPPGLYFLQVIDLEKGEAWGSKVVKE